MGPLSDTLIFDNNWDILLYGSPLKAYGSETDTADSSGCDSFEEKCKPLHLQDLPQSVKLNILQFLDVESLAAARAVDRESHKLLRSSKSSEALQAVWKPAVQRQWPWLKTDNTELQDSTTAHGDQTDLARLIRLAAQSKSHAVDQDMFVPPVSPPRTTTRRTHGRTASSNNHNHNNRAEPELHLLDEARNAVHFRGAVGVGDRCVRAKDPLPHPLEQVAVVRASRLQRCKKTAKKLLHLKQAKQQLAQWKPFVAPFAASSGCYNLTPRLVSYYEVTIVPASEDLQNNKEGKTECVAVGVAVQDFNLHKYMPGWDKHSFGYHGDDGGFYHASGHPVAIESGGLPNFGAGDCVGCGIDYEKNALFYTKNGQFLGYATQLTEEQLLQEWFPVVGVDTNCPVQCNFGTSTDTPFQFDLSGLVARQKEAVLHALLR